MKQISFVEDWTFRREAEHGDVAEHPVRLPHDAMLVEGRAPDAPSGAHGSHFLGGRYVYTKRWTVPEELTGRRLALLLEGVQGRTRVLVNGTDVGGTSNGYTELTVDLGPALRAGENSIEVRVDSSGQPSSRWYTGAGIYRPVWLQVRGLVSFAADGLRLVTTLDPAAPTTAVLELTYAVDGAVPDGAEVGLVLRDGDDVVAETVAPVGRGRLEVTVPEARLWTAEDPHTYRAEVRLRADGGVLDAEDISVGLRTVEVQAGRGLLVNGKVTLLRGACVHHDHGVLGAATFGAAERRRVRILKENGYNAIRSSHNPASRDLLVACDELGLYVVDELTDVWTVPKTAHDGAATFCERWPEELRTMVAKDRNHPSVIMYSVGNEIAETADPDGVALTGQLSRAARALDPTRPTTEAINFLLNVMAGSGVSAFDATGEREAKAGRRKTSSATSTAANAVTNKIGGIQKLVALLPRADRLTKDSFSHVDVAGYNYAGSRYARDARRYPHRVVLGSETMPGDIAENWAKVEQLPNVIGDFTWTGWDYLGEAGLGSWLYGGGDAVMNRSYPHLVAGCGAIDITGVPGAPSLLSRAVWGELDAPAIAVRPLDRAGQKVARTAWRSTDAISSWSWRRRLGVLAEVEVYSAMDRVELFLNGRSVGSRRTGPRHGYLARFEVPYEHGELVAVGRSGRMERTSLLRSAGSDLGLRLTADRTVLDASGQDLAFVAVEVTDRDGVVEMLADEDVTVEVSGAGALAGLGSAVPSTARSFLDTVTRTYYGRALAVVRADVHAGPVSVRATARGLGEAVLTLDVQEPGTTAGPARGGAS